MTKLLLTIVLKNKKKTNPGKKIKLTSSLMESSKDRRRMKLKKLTKKLRVHPKLQKQMMPKTTLNNNRMEKNKRMHQDRQQVKVKMEKFSSDEINAPIILLLIHLKYKTGNEPNLHYQFMVEYASKDDILLASIILMFISC